MALRCFGKNYEPTGLKCFYDYITCGRFLRLAAGAVIDGANLKKLIQRHSRIRHSSNKMRSAERRKPVSHNVILIFIVITLLYRATLRETRQNRFRSDNAKSCYAVSRNAM